jgi:hypothetical protein
MSLSPRRAVLASLVCLAGLAGTTASAQDIQATVQIEAAGQPAMTMDYWTSEESVRLDLSQPMAVSIVFTSGDAPGMLMIQHGERRYIEFGAAQLQMMRQLLSGAGGGGESPGAVNLDSVGFEPTGQTETIGPWTATAVRITGLEPGQESTMWIAPDLASGLFELLASMGDALEAMQMPLLGGGAGGLPQQLTRYQQMSTAAGLPEGGVVRLNASDQNGPTTITLQSLAEGPFAEDPFAPPAGYEKMQMPSLPE